MSKLRCTKKLLDQAELKPEQDTEDSGNDWHANLIWIDRRKTILFCSDATLFCCVAADVRKSDIRSMESLFITSLTDTMRFEGYSPGIIAQYVMELRPVEIRKSSNRSVLGSMNDYVFHLKYLVEDAGGLAHSDMGAVAHNLNIIPQVKRSFFNAIEAFDQSIKERFA